MKNFYTFLVGIFAFSLGFGQITTSYDFSSGSAVTGLNESSPGISLDANIGFGSFKNSGTSNPALNSGQLRLYQNGTKGGSIVIYANNGFAITNITINASGTTGPAGYIVDNGSQVNMPASNTYSISGINATSQVEFFQRDGSSSNRIYVDSFEVTYTSGGPNNPDTFTATLASSSQVDLNYDDNTDGDTVVIVFNTDNNFTTPSGSPTAVGTSFAGGTVLVNSTGSGTYNHTGLNASTTYYYKAFSYDSSNYSLGIDADITTPCNSISAFPFIEDFEDNGNTIPNCWSQSYEIDNVDWTFNTNGDDGGNGNSNTAHSGTRNALFLDGNSSDDITKLILPAFDFTSLANPELSFWHTQEAYSSDQDELRVYYKTSSASPWVLLASYTDDLENWTKETIALPNTSTDYYIAFEGNAKWGYGIALDDIEIKEGLPPNDSNSEVAGGTQPTTTSIDALTDTEAEAVDVFAMEIYDWGTTDGQPTIVTNIRLYPHSTNTADWTNTIQGVTLSNGSAITLGPVTITDSFIDITIPPGNLNVVDSDIASVTVGVYLNSNNLSEGDILSFMIDADNHGFTADEAGSTFATNFDSNFNSNDFTVSIEATQLSYIQQPNDVNVFEVMSPSVEIAYTDANGNIDLDYDGIGFDISLTTTGSFDGTATTTATAVNGVAHFNNLSFNTTGTGLTITATDDSTLIIGTFESDSFNITSPAVVIAIQDFDNTSPSWSYNNEIAFFDNGWGGGFFGIRDIGSSFPIDQSNMSNNILAENDMEDSPDGTSGFATISFSTIDVSAFSDVTLTFDWQVEGYNASNDDVRYEIFYDSVGQGDVYLHDGNDTPEDSQGTETITIPENVNTVSLNIEIRNNGQDGYSGFDNFRLEGSYDGYIYTAGSWVPTIPNNTTNTSDAIIADGVAVLNSDVNLNNLVVNPGAGLEVATSTTLTVNTLALESTSTSYSSLILDGTITGTVTYNRYTNAYTNDATNNDNDLISTPLIPLNGEFFAAFATTNPNLLESGTLRAFAPFNNTTGLYENYDVVANASTSLTPGTGYRAATSDGSTLAFIGTAETGDVYKDIIVGDDPTYGEWNLIGNPYPSYIDAEAFLTHTVSTAFSGETNMDLLVNASGIYGYDGDTSDGWKVITLANDNGQLIAPGQGFFVAADADDTLFHDVEFTPAMRTTGNADDFIQGRSNTTLNFVKLRASTANHSYNTEFYFDDNASLGLDPGYDAVVWGGTAPSTFALYSHLVQNNSGMPIALQALGSADLSNVTIPLGLNANAGESLTISISEMNTPVAVNVYLEDYQNNTLTLLNDTDFVINPIDNLNGTGRFYLRLSNSVLSTTDNVFDTVSIYANQANRTINISGQLTDDTFAKVYDIQGRLVSTTALDANATRQTIDASNLNTGVYIVKLTNNNITKTEKIILK
ncbi:T9SS type A sorting domain-containing protein [uncultured Winogradskyella sp.]|uniref:T9SS type A sorting domain-containing protein n=1 Tax=uncultured Winogradskyella sp. TaxID=395353 RepID=UPI002614F031|nr:T9SS type A sorting domain-containing protein [uncultured Winogradskyella sp.]